MIQKKQNQLFFSTMLLAASNTTITEPTYAKAERVYRNEYSADYPKHPIRVKLEAGDLKYLPRVTFDLNLTSESIITWPWDIAGALCAFTTVYKYNSDTPHTTAVQAILSVLIPLFPRLFNYMVSPADKPSSKMTQENRESSSGE